MALLQADGAYDLERGVNRGDAGDVYHANGASALHRLTVPSTASYQHGQMNPTQNRISAISSSGPTMTFTYENLSPERDVIYAIDLEKDAGWITGVIDGPRTCYSLDQGAVADFRSVLGPLLEQWERASCCTTDASCT